MDLKNVSQLPQEIKSKYQDISEMQNLKEQLRKFKNNEDQIIILNPIPIKQIKSDKFLKLLEKIRDADSNKATKKKCESVLKEIKEYDLSKQTLELCQTILDCQMHQSNIKFLVELCVTLNSYNDFNTNFVKFTKRQIDILDKKQGNYENEDKRAKKRKNLLRLLAELHQLTIDNETFLELLRLLLPMNQNIEFLLTNLQVIQNFMQHFAHEYFSTFRLEIRNDIQTYPELSVIFSEKKSVTTILGEKKIIKQIEQVIRDYINYIETNLINLYKQIQDDQNNDGSQQKIKENKSNFLKLKDSYKNIMDCMGQYDPDNNKQNIDKVEEDEKILNLYIKDFQQIIDDSDCFAEEEKKLYTQLITIEQVQEPQLNTKKDYSSIETVDQMALEFQNTKPNRRKLYEDILMFRQNFIILLPYQCRLIATLCKNQKEAEEEVTKLFLDNYKFTKSNEHQDKKNRYLRYICELTKFRVLKQDIILDIFSQLIEDIINQNIELIVVILENCGRFLKYSQESSKKFEFLLNQLDKQRKLKPLGQQIDSQFSKALLSFDRIEKPKKEKPILEQYIKYLIFDKLDNLDIDNFLKLPLNQLKIKQYLNKQLFKITVKGRFQTQPIIAGLLAALKQYYPDITGQVVDALIDEIQCGLEDNNINKRQRRITVTKMFGHLYAYQIIDKDLIFRLLYHIIQFGHDQVREAEILDPPDDSFRINQVISLIESLTDYYKSLRNELVSFLIHFQRYVLSKKYLPQTVEFALLDLYESIDKRIIQIKTLKIAEQLCLSLNGCSNVEDLLNKIPEQNVQQVNFDKQQTIDQKELEQTQNIEKEFDMQFQKMLKESQSEQKQVKSISNQNQKARQIIIKGNGDVKILSKDQQTKKLNVNDWLGFQQ